MFITILRKSLKKPTKQNQPKMLQNSCE